MVSIIMAGCWNGRKPTPAAQAFSELFTFGQQDLLKLNNPLENGVTGTVLSNPPYGERLESEPALVPCTVSWGG